ncbi:MAG: hypothetical protein A2Y64_00850 [Candidatus Coatesbacteria bacterium RBG_13_66_14]|uniref:Uncharacterized protein n=1 Tax=Candidatus Coatesbacteria bacterium RBG_13_66_14 TaxID=1817816 RepID=A0A1F5F4G9_9BACT|nr:MAG: hypothetical protein A2Y64_00850 [Candidatus Coatesbacteria bacterium RBG_13_66_14]
MEKLDAASSALLGITPGRHRAAELLRSLKDAYTAERGYEVCGGCSWLPRMDCPRVIEIRLKELFPKRGAEQGV